MNAETWSGALRSCELLAGVAIALQSVELLRLAPEWGEGGTWRWSILRRSFDAWPAGLRRLLDAVLGPAGFRVLLWLRLGAALLLVLPVELPVALRANALFVVLGGTLLIAWRWQGTFNGGSDAMTVVVAGSLWVARAFGSDRPWLARAALLYIAVQATLSYFVAGVAKARRASWWDGSAPLSHARLPAYAAPPALLGALARPGVARAAGIATVAFELAFPLAWTRPEAAVGLLGLGAIFHLGNFWAFGLNRFFWIWIATYPAVLAAARGVLTRP